MRIPSCLVLRFKYIFILSLIILIGSCGGGDSSVPAPTISIETPTSESVYATTATTIRLGGRISGASFVHVENLMTGFNVDG